MHTQKNKIFKTLVITSLLIFLIINSKTIPSSTKIKFLDLAAPFLKAIRSTCDLAKKMVPFAGLREENKRLRDRVALMNRRLDEVKIISDENDRLKSLINFKHTVPYATVPCQVIGRDPTNWSNSLIINKGLENGIRGNKAVISTKGLVGRLVEVGRYSAKVLLITDPNSKVGVLIQRTRHGGILTGRPDGRCKMIYIALDSDAAVGDKVITAGFGGIFPKDILVGDVTDVGKEPGRLYKYAIVKPAADLSKLEEVLCIK